MRNRKNALPLKDLCQLVKNGRFEEAMHLVADAPGREKSAALDEDPLYQSALFWKGTMDASASLDRYPASEFLTSRWDEFALNPAVLTLPESFRYALKEYVYNKALSGYLELYNISGIADTVVLSRMAKLRKGLGEYDLAIKSYEMARGRAMEDARITAALADCYALIDETRAAKLLFREAFFLDPGAVDLGDCEASFIREIADRLASSGVPAEDITYWIPVLATAEGLFNVRRELKPVEIGRLTQSIRELEQTWSDQPADRTRALLLNRYFWLADHYAGIKAPREDLEAVLMKIKQLDPEIYERYIH